MKENLRIVFMGTPDFAVASLRALVEGGYRVVGVVTMPDKPAGRGMKLQHSPVKEYALSQHIPLLQPEKLKSPEFLDELRALKADLQIVVAFRMLPEVVWDMPRLGTFNLHASLLPQYRGAAPINWAVINGETETGVTTFFLSHEIDTGKIIFQEKVPVTYTDTAGTVYDKLMKVGASLVSRTVDALLEGKCDAVPQEQFFSDASELKKAPKIFKETCRIDWSKTPVEIYHFVRGLSPYPAAWTELDMPNGDKLAVKVYESIPVDKAPHSDIETVSTDGKTFIEVAAKGGSVRLLSIQPAGKKRMAVEEFLRGYRL